MELRRGDDYSFLDTKADVAAYDPEKLSMERTEGMFSPEDRIGALEIQNLSVADNRQLLLHYAKLAGKLSEGTATSLTELLSENPAGKKKS